MSFSYQYVSHRRATDPRLQRLADAMADAINRQAKTKRAKQVKAGKRAQAVRHIRSLMS